MHNNAQLIDPDWRLYQTAMRIHADHVEVADTYLRDDLYLVATLKEGHPYRTIPIVLVMPDGTVFG